MPASHSIGDVCRRVLCNVLIVCAAIVEYGHAQNEEPSPLAVAEESVDEPYCPAIEHRPLTALTVDISPLSPEGEAVAQEDMPRGCLPEDTTEPLPFLITYGPECWNCHDLLQLARFCHPRLYFEDVMVERYGVEPVFPCLHSTAQFTCDLFLLPARLLVNKRCPCVRTPTPHCWSGCSVCGY